MDIKQRLFEEVIQEGICTGCGACVGLDPEGCAQMRDTDDGPVPDFRGCGELPELAWSACPGKGINYPRLYKSHYGKLPDNWLIGHLLKVRVGFASDADIRARGASGGVISRVLIYLLETGRVDAAIIVQQGIGGAENAGVRIARSREEILKGAQSVYIPVSTLDILGHLKRAERYAMSCLPDQSASLRQMQIGGFSAARQVEFLVGPYMGTALRPAAIRSFLKSKRVREDDCVTSLRWRAGGWPGYLEIKTASGAVIRTKKVYYNFLTPFFVTQSSLQGMDFTNEFCDLSVGDAWSPVFERAGGGYSVVVTRSPEMEEIVCEMISKKLLTLKEEEVLAATDMHGHMLDFKKRGSYLRNRWRRFCGRKSPDYGIRPKRIPASRIVIEIVISTIFILGRTSLARRMVEIVPESILGPVFNVLRLLWKRLSKPTKRKGLSGLEMEVTQCR